MPAHRSPASKRPAWAGVLDAGQRQHTCQTGLADRAERLRSRGRQAGIPASGMPPEPVKAQGRRQPAPFLALAAGMACKLAVVRWSPPIAANGCLQRRNVYQALSKIGLFVTEALR